LIEISIRVINGGLWVGVISYQQAGRQAEQQVSGTTKAAKGRRVSKNILDNFFESLTDQFNIYVQFNVPFGCTMMISIKRTIIRVISI
jgi:hypothetical protein